ncbi:MAG: protein translocase subunit SecD [Candidatus Omnitrophota bacterium]
MDRRLQWKIVGLIALAIAAVYLILPPFSVYDQSGNVIQKGKINLGLDLQGGMHLVLKLDSSKISEESKKDALDRAIEIIRNRVDQFGVSEMSIQKQGADHIIVQMPGITDRDRALEIVKRTAHLEFRIVSDDVQLVKDALEGKEVEGFEIKEMATERGSKEPMLVEVDAALTGDMLVDAQTQFASSGFGEPYVSITMSPKGGAIFSTLTAANVGKRLAIVLDGKVQSAPVIREPIPSGRAQISGRFSVDEANDLAIVLRAGALPAPVIVEEERTVGPLLGKDSITSGIRATLIGGSLVFVFILIYYGLAGLVSCVALLLNIILVLAALSLFKGTLTLPGIAGLILTIGMAVDANVLIFERIREEIVLGKSVRAAIPAGYRRAFLTILDANVTTLIAAVLLFKFGSGPIRGFAVTLTTGILASLFTSIIVTRTIFDVLITQFDITKLRMMQFFPATKIDFIGKRKICFITSIIAIVIGLGIFGARGEDNYGVDFAGGTLQQFLFKGDTQIDRVRDSLKEIGLGNASIQQYGNLREVIIRTPEASVEDTQAIFRKNFGEGSFELMRVDTVGPAVGKVLRKHASLALFYGILGILIYVMFRFNLKYAFAGVIALFHDVFITIGVLAIAQRQLDLTIVAALLTIAGYSINDTIVIYARIRENMRFAKKTTFADLVNMSINQTLSRTMLTSLTTLLVVVSVLFWGGDVLRGFAICLFVGILTGTYSTIFIATPLILSWQGKQAGRKR